MQEKYWTLLTSSELDDVLEEGAKKANAVANETLQKIYQAIGF